MVPRTTYLLRAGPIDDVVRDAALCIAKAGADMVGPLFSPTATEQIGLPLCLGGCGLPVPTSTLAAAALLSSAALTQAALWNAPALLRPSDGPHRVALQQMWHNVQICAPGLWGPELEPLPDPLSDHTLTQAQYTYARHRAQSTYKELLWDIDQPPQLRPQTLARLRSLACRSASAWLEAVPAAFPLRLSDGDFRAALRRLLGESNLPQGARAAPCFCRALIGSTDAEYALTCHAPNALRVLHHDEIVDVVRRALRRGGLPSTKEPGLVVLHPSAMGPRPPAGARGDLLFSLEGEQSVGDVSVIHPGSATYCAAAATTGGGAAAQRDADQTSQCRRYRAGCYRFVPLTVETCSRLGRPFMDSPMCHPGLASTATAPSCASSLCRRNAALEQAVAGCFVRVSGGCYSPGLNRPTAEVG
jgi:hypothetical protein